MQITYRRLAATTLVAGVLAALPAASASASPGSSSSRLSLNVGGTLGGNTSLVSPEATIYELNKVLTPTQVQELLSSLPIGTGAGAISPEALAKALASLPVLQGLNISDLETSLKGALEKLGDGNTLTVLQDPTSLVSALAKTLEDLLGGEGLLGLKLLSGESLSTRLEGALVKVNLSELLAELLGSSDSPQALLEELLSSLPTERVEAILGGKLGESPLTITTVGGLASDLGITVEELAKQLGVTLADLPETLKVLLDPLSNGEVLSVLDGTNSIVLDTLSSLLGLEGSKEGTGKEGTGGEGTGSGEGGKGGTGEGGTGSGGSSSGEGGTGEGTGSGEGGTGSGGPSSGEGGKGGSGGAGNSGAGGSGSSGTTLTVNVPSTTPAPATTTTTTAPTAKAKKAAAKTTGKIVVLQHTVHGFVASIVVRAPGAGKLKVRNKDVSAVNRHVGKARKLSFKIVLSKAGAAAARRGHAHSLGVKLRIVFTPTDGVRSHAIVKLRFR